MGNQEKKAAQQAAADSARTKQLIQRVALWGGVIVVLGLAVYGVMRLGASNRSGATLGAGEVVPAVNAKDWTKGSSIAKLTLVEYSDFQCPACANYEPLLRAVTQEYAGTVLFAYRHFPLPQHQNALAAATAAEAAGKQGKFWDMHDVLFDNQRDWENSRDAKTIFISYAKALQLNVDQFQKDFDDSATQSKIKSDQADGEAGGIDSTPTLFLNGKKVSPNPINFAEFKQLIETALQTTK